MPLKIKCTSVAMYQNLRLGVSGIRLASLANAQMQLLIHLHSRTFNFVNIEI